MRTSVIVNKTHKHRSQPRNAYIVKCIYKLKLSTKHVLEVLRRAVYQRNIYNWTTYDKPIIYYDISYSSDILKTCSPRKSICTKRVRQPSPC